MNANRYWPFHFDVQTILVYELESPFATLEHHNIQIGILRLLIVQHSQRRLFVFLHVVDSVKDKAGTRQFSLHWYPIDQQIAFDEIVIRKLVFECLIDVEY